MSENEELKLDAYQIGIIESGNREKLLQLLREDANIIPVEGEDGSTTFRRREDGEGDFSLFDDLMKKEEKNTKAIEDLNRRIDELDKKVNNDDKLIDKNIKDRNIGNGEESKTLIYLKNQKKILNQERREAINKYYNEKYNGGFIPFGSVNSNERLINDMNLQKIKE